MTHKHMTWVKVDDHFHEHPKILAVPAKDRTAAKGLFLDGLLYASRNLTDGRMPKGFVAETDMRIAEILVSVGLWHDSDLEFKIHDYTDWNRSKSDIEKLREVRKAAGSMGGIASGKSRREANAKQKRSETNPDTDIERSKNSCPKRTSDETDALFAGWYSKYPRKEGRGAALRAYRAALKKADAPTLLAGVERSAKAWGREGRERKHVPLPATWLNQERWADEYDDTRKRGGLDDF